MIGYPYISQLFQAILDNSDVMDGRFFVCPKWGSELANPNIDEQLPIGAAKSQKYPAVLLMPPPIEGNFEYQGQVGASGNILYDCYGIKLLFVTNATNTGNNQPMQPNALESSTHTIMQTQHDMMRCAKNFVAKLFESIRPLGGTIIIDDSTKEKILLITDLGGDKVSGVLLSFRLMVFSGCVIEDYPSGIIATPALTDTHPLHSM